MKHALVLSIENGVALLAEGGRFCRVPARRGWRKGDLVAVSPAEAPAPRRLALLAACAALVCGLFAGSYFWPAALVSLDVNPSIEFGVNAFGRVVNTTARNEEAAALTRQVDVRHMNYTSAVETVLLSSDMQPYVGKAPEIVLAVMAPTGGMENAMTVSLRTMAEQALSQRSVGAHVSCYQVDRQLVDDARGHHVTPGKYCLMMELQRLDPAADLEECAAQGIGELTQRIGRCGGGCGVDGCGCGAQSS